MSSESLIRQFTELARGEAASVDRAEHPGELPGLVAAYLSAAELPSRIVTATDGLPPGIDWAGAALKVSTGPLGRDGDTALTGCYGGIAEAGALVILASPGHPAEMNFLPATHIVVLREADLVPDFETLWNRLRQDFSADAMPRCMSFVVGPSRTADLGVPSKLGAHGPARVHIILVGE